MPRQGLDVARMRQSWNDFRCHVTPSYERLAASLATYDIHVPSLRPRNHARNVFHAVNGFVAIVALQHVLGEAWAPYVAGAIAASAWFMETGRRVSTRMNDFLMAVFQPVAHPHESWRVNSATWFSTALFVLSLLHNALAATVALCVLAVADPIAALVGRRHGRIRLLHGRTLEGTLAFVVSGVAVAVVVLSLYYPGLSWPTRILLALAGTLPASLAELVSRRVDDNLSIPLAAAAGVLALTYV